MATNSSTARQNGKKRQQESEAYFNRLDPYGDGISVTTDEGERAVGEVDVYDDREESSTIHVQFKQFRKGGSKVAVLHVDEEGFAELVDDLIAAREEFGL
jgi:hypothetical protein